MKKFPEDPRNCNPIQLLYQMKPGVKFIETIISSKMPSDFQMNCEIDTIPFTGRGNILVTILITVLLVKLIFN